MILRRLEEEDLNLHEEEVLNHHGEVQEDKGQKGLNLEDLDLLDDLGQLDLQQFLQMMFIIELLLSKVLY